MLDYYVEALLIRCFVYWIHSFLICAIMGAERDSVYPHLPQSMSNASIGKRGAAGAEAAEMLLQLRSAATRDGRVPIPNGPQPQRRSLNLRRNLSHHLDQVVPVWRLE